MTVKEIAARLNVSVVTAYLYHRQVGSWDLAALRKVQKLRASRDNRKTGGDKQRHKKAAMLRARGWKWARIGAHLGVTASCAHKLASKHIV